MRELPLSSAIDVLRNAWLAAVAGSKAVALPTDRINILRFNIRTLHENTDIGSYRQLLEGGEPENSDEARGHIEDRSTIAGTWTAVD